MTLRCQCSDCGFVASATSLPALMAADGDHYRAVHPPVVPVTALREAFARLVQG